jgi:hypothetical protein
MINRLDFFNFLKRNFDKDYSKEEIINTFSNSIEEEKEIDNLLSEIEVEYTIAHSNLLVTCKAGTVYYKWVAS